MQYQRLDQDEDIAVLDPEVQKVMTSEVSKIVEDVSEHPETIGGVGQAGTAVIHQRYVDKHISTSSGQTFEVIIDSDPVKNNVPKETVRNLITFWDPKGAIKEWQDPKEAGKLYTILNYMLFDSPKVNAKGDRVLGFVRIRGGHFDSKESADRHAQRLIQEGHDRRFVNFVVPIGEFAPISESVGFSRDITDVDTNVSKNETNDKAPVLNLRTEAAKKVISKQRQEIAEMREAEERKKLIQEQAPDPGTLDHYGMQRITYMKFQEHVQALRHKLQEAEKTWDKILKDCAESHLRNPEYGNIWLDVYNEKRKSTGLKPIYPTEEEFKAYYEAVERFSSERGSSRAPALSLPPRSAPSVDEDDEVKTRD